MFQLLSKLNHVRITPTLDFLTLFFSLGEFQRDKLADLGVQVSSHEWAVICSQKQHMAGLLLAEVTCDHSLSLLSLSPSHSPDYSISLFLDFFFPI